jgi:serine phosphatase RsbU (regulator of sigma subunit)
MKFILSIILGLSLLVVTGQQPVDHTQKVNDIYSKIDWSLERTELLDRMLDEVVQLRETDDLTSAKIMLDTIMYLAQQSEGVEFQYARSFIDAAIIARMEGNDNLMVAHYQEAIDIYKGLQATSHDTLQKVLTKNLSICYNNAAQVFLNKEEYNLALEFYRNAVQSVIPLQDSLTMSIGYYNMAQTFGYMNEHDSAYKYILMSKELEHAMNSDEGLAYAHEGLATVFNNKEEFLVALKHLDSSLLYASNIGDEFFKLDLVELKADILLNIKGITEAIEILELGVLKSKGIGYKGFEVRASEKLSGLYEEVGDFKKAYYYTVALREFDAADRETETQKKIEEFQIQYQTEQKDKEIEQLALQNELKEEANKNLMAKRRAEESKNRIIYWSFGGGIVMLSLIGVMLFADSRRRKRTNSLLKSNNEDLARKNEQILHQSRLIGDSINYAQNIQRAILPTRKEMGEEFADHFELFLPKDVVSGDFYWMHSIPETKKVLFSVADCTGHGVPGAFMSIVGHALLEKIAKQLHIYSPPKVLNQLAYELQTTLKKGEGAVDDGMDMALVLIDYDTNKLHFSGARNPLLIVSDGELTLFKGDRIDLGKQTDVAFNQVEYDFKKGDKIYLFSDGFPDQKGGPEAKKYYGVRFREFIKSISARDMSAQKKKLLMEFEEWKGDLEQMDDILVVGIEL